MRTVEWVILAYCAYGGVLAAVRPIGATRRWTAWGLVVIMASAVAAAALFAGSRATAAVRDWLPAFCILLGYWLSGTFFTRPMVAWEQWLDAIDQRFAVAGWRIRAVDGVLELAYLSVYLVVPAGFAVVYFGVPGADPDRYWTPVVIAEFGCYALLPWIQTRPPRARGSGALDGSPGWFRRANLTLLERGSIQANTFPSAHAAGAVATALAVMAFVPWAGVAFLIWALLIAAGSVAGRYHYVADAVLGTVWAIVVSVATRQTL